VLIDTNVYVALRRGHAGAIRMVHDAEGVLVSAVVAGELLYGFRAGSRYERNRAELDDFLRSPRVALLPVTLDTADRFGRIAAGLRRSGRPLASNDIWIAAHAMETGAELLSFDRDFESVDGLAWTIPPDA
jgi:predicted nucleic acid-binding protein